MNLEDEFDEIFRQRAEGAKFSFRESDWEKARALIDRDRMSTVRTGSGKIYWYASAVVLVSATALLYLASPESVTSTNDDEVVQESEPVHEGSNYQQKTAHFLQELKGSNPTKVKVAVIPSFQPESKLISSANNRVKVTPKIASLALASHNQSGIMPASATAEPPASNSQASGLTIGLSASGSDVAVQKDPALLTEKELKPAESEIDNSFLQHTAFFSKSFSSPELELQLTYLKRYQDDYYEKRKVNRNFVNIESGLIFSGGWDNGGSITAKGINAFAGINYGHYFSKEFALGTGLQVYNLSHMNQVFCAITQKNYSFGSTLTQTMMTCNSMIFAAIPLKVFYAPDEKHLIGLGVNMGYLVSSRNTIETYGLSDGVKQNYNSSSSNCIYENMSSTNVVLTASLMKKINRKWSAQLELNYGLSDLFINTQLNTYVQNTNGLRISMNYNIFNK